MLQKNETQIDTFKKSKSIVIFRAQLRLFITGEDSSIVFMQWLIYYTGVESHEFSFKEKIHSHSLLYNNQ